MLRFTLVVVLIALFVPPVQAAVTLVHSERTLDVIGQLGYTDTLPDTNLMSFSDKQPQYDYDHPPLYQQTLQDSIGSAQFGAVSATASQVSSFDVGTDNQLNSVVCSASAAASAAMQAAISSYMMGQSSCNFDIQVTDAPVRYSVSYAFTPVGPDSSEGGIGFFDAANNLTTIAHSYWVTAGTGQQTGILQPGYYYFWSYAISDSMTDASPVALAADMTYTLTFTSVPEPATLSLLALGGLLIARRRQA